MRKLLILLALSLPLFSCSVKTPQLEIEQACELQAYSSKKVRQSEKVGHHVLYTYKGDFDKTIKEQLKCVIYATRIKHEDFSVSIRNTKLDTLAIFTYGKGLFVTNNITPRDGMYLRMSNLYFDGDSVIDTFILPEEAMLPIGPSMVSMGFEPPNYVEKSLEFFDKKDDED